MRNSLKAVLSALAAGFCCAGLSGPALAQPLQPTVPAPLVSSYQSALLDPVAPDFGYPGSSPAGSRLGGFQMGSWTLREAGLQTEDGSWSDLARALGINSPGDFLRNPTAQVVAESSDIELSLSYLQSAMGGTAAYSAQLGKPDRTTGTVMSSAAMAFCAQSLGAGGCASYLSTGVLPRLVIAQNPDWAGGGWQRKLAAISSTALPLTTETAEDQRNVDIGKGWLRVRQMNVLRPPADQAWVAAAWLQYGGHALPGALALPLTYQTFERAGRRVILGIALSAGCDMGENDASSTQLHAVCPISVITITGKGVQAQTYPAGCYMWTATLPPGPETDPTQNATYVHFDASGTSADLVTMRHGQQIPECSKRVAS